ncbi:MAG: NTP transferase domain-containing protein [Oscillospiraceae bacterium]
MTAALIIAAGKTQHREKFDPMRPVGGLSAVQRLVRVYQQAGICRIVLVAQDLEAVEKHVARMGVVCLQNGCADAEMLDSVKIGLAYLQGKCERVQVTPVSVPLYTVETVKRLAALHEPLVIPLHEHASGHPVQLGAELFGNIIDYEGPGGLAGAIQALGMQRLFVEVPDAGVLLNIEQNGDYEELLARHSLNRLLPVVRLNISREDYAYGPGTQQLLRLVNDTQSLRLACQQMGISYGKGWKMVNNIEAMFDGGVLVRQPGGKHGGGTTVTEKGQRIIARYDAWVKASREKVEELFNETFLGPDGKL